MADKMERLSVVAVNCLVCKAQKVSGLTTWSLNEDTFRQQWAEYVKSRGWRVTKNGRAVCPLCIDDIKALVAMPDEEEHP